MELLVARLPTTFHSSFDQTACLEGCVEAVLVGSLATLGIGGFIHLLLCRVTQSSEGYGSTASTLEDNGRPLKDTFYEMFSLY